MQDNVQMTFCLNNENNVCNLSRRKMSMDRQQVD